MNETPDLSRSFHPVPKIYKAKKEPKALGAGKRTKGWESGRENLKKQFEAYGITRCEIRLEGCLDDNFLGFAHTRRRVNFTQDEVIDPQNVVLACQACHNTVDNEMPQKDSYKLLDSIVLRRVDTL